MKKNPIQDILSSIGIPFPGKNLIQKYAHEKAPMRADLFSADQMESHGRSLASKHKVQSGRAANILLKRLAENEEQLLEVHQLLTDAVKSNRRIIPAGEWLLDNFYLILEQIQTGKRHLPKGYSEDLPLLLNGPSAGLPRVYDIAVEIISHSDGRIDLRNLGSFVNAYQEIIPLKLGELWAIPIMLRLALIENLRRLSTQIAFGRIQQNLADYWAEKMTTTAEKDPKNLILVIADMARSNPPMESAFVAELTRHLQGRGPALALPLTWIEHRLSETGHSGIIVIANEIQKQASEQLSMSNSIGSLRFLGTMDWRNFVESISIVEKILRTDINGIYPAMDFATRDSYRHVVEKLSKHSQLSEQEVANTAIRSAKNAASRHGEQDRSAHVGYFLVGKGLAQIEHGTTMTPSFSERLQRFIKRSPLLFYLGNILLITLLVGGLLALRAYHQGTPFPEQGWVILLCLLCACQLAVTLVNWLTSIFVQPRLLPRMDFSGGITPECRSVVVIPSMLQDPQQIESLAESLEIYYLANKDPHLHFSLLTDFHDAPAASMPEDEALLACARQSIEKLNAKYASSGDDIFFLFHRPRKWNPHDKIWMGYERKRGKLTELNALLRGEGMDAFSLVVGSPVLFPLVKYVITIDTDTQLPRDSARNIIATMAHPLNRAVYDEKKKRVTEGYGILQPRVALSLTGSAHSLYAKWHGTDLGIDPYTRMVSDIYQDLFDEGSFIGKGIYEVDMFRKGLDNRFPENVILSHDLLEGCFLRSGLLSDVQMYEEYPSRYSDDVKRRHRWTRGDWQIAAWCLPMIPVPGKGMQKNPLSGLSRWKIFDNLRRSWVPTALLFLLISGWTFLHDAWFWTIAIVVLLLFPQFIIALRDMLRKPKEIQLKQHFKDSIQAILNNLFQTLFALACLPYEAFFTLDAILRSVWRLVVSHRNLLEWTLFENRRTMQGEGLRAKYLYMLISPALGIAGLIYLSVHQPMDHFIADPILILWILAPAIAWRLSRPLSVPGMTLDQTQVAFLRRIARKTWGYFEQFVTLEDNWLPPDNYQEHPVERTAHRTSPTNMGLALLSNLAAVDLGYVTSATFLDRTAKTIGTMQRMERYNGHFYNWYDTQTLQPLPPRYISTVDSGNLTGQLITLRQGILAIPGEPIIKPAFAWGLMDTLLLMEEELKDPIVLQPLHRLLTSWLDLESPTLSILKPLVDELVDETLRIRTSLPSWSAAWMRQCRDAQEECTRFSDWIMVAPAPERLVGLLHMDRIPHLSELALLDQRLAQELLVRELLDPSVTESQWLEILLAKVSDCTAHAKQRMALLDHLNLDCLDLSETAFDFLYDNAQHLLSIGYNTDDHRRDPSFYDLLASEARLSTFVGIAQGKLPQESWFALGRQLTHASGESVLLSWSGSVFEYLMPLLYMPTYANTLLDETYKVMVKRQIEYGERLGVPWGISESGYNLVDASLNLQYRAFGVPELGLKRGLSEDLVIAPYATLMSLMVAPGEATSNLRALSAVDMEGPFGFYESIDYTPSRLPRGQTSVAIRSFMAHHQGMGLLSLDYLLCDRPMQKRFESEPQFQATLLLLQERIPKTTKYFTPPPDIANISVESGETEMRVIRNPDTPTPEVQLLSNGNYHVMITHAGGGYSRWKNIAVTRWREDATCDNWGNFCFLRDMEKGDFWSIAHQPSVKPAKSYEAVFSQGRAEFRRMDNDIETHTEIAVSPEDDVEIRRVHIANRSKRKRYIELTSYAEVVLAPAAADTLHPAFSNLFVQTEIIPQKNAILCTRRPRSQEETPPWMFHLMRTDALEVEKVSFETDRMQFIGRGHTIKKPRALMQTAALSGAHGSVLDPVVSIQYRLTIPPMETITVDMVYGISDTREYTEGLIGKYQDPSFIARAFELAWTHSQMVLRQINASESDAQLFSRLAGSVIHSNGTLRADPAILLRNHKGQSGLWGYSISGDLPIVLLQISDIENIGMVRQLVQAHAYWRLKGLMVDLVIWNEDYGGYRHVLQNQLLGLISAGTEMEASERPGGIFVRVAEQIAMEDRILIQSVARLVLSDSKGSLMSQVSRRPAQRASIPLLIPSVVHVTSLTEPEPVQGTAFFNGLGGFSDDGDEYIIHTDRSKPTPVPWSNVLSNPRFGTVVTESGQAYTWFENAHEYRLTPWNNDPVCDGSGEAFYIRDEDSGHFWSPSSLPCSSRSEYVTRHGFGYSRFDHREAGISSQLITYVDLESPVKYTVITLRNYGDTDRKLSLTGYVEWVLADLRPKSLLHIHTEVDPRSGALFASNPYNKEFDGRTCFFAVSQSERGYTCDRAEFIGRNRSLSHPDAMDRARLSGKSGPALDPCAALQVHLDLEVGQERQIIFLLGTGQHADEATNLVLQSKSMTAAALALEKVKAYWKATLGAVVVHTPDSSLNYLANGWLLYQTLACRFQARSGFYQSGGAFGFRDQLQDAMALLHAEPQKVRAHVLASAARQFREGDVQHWWHPPTGRGVRTRCSDDLLWLPFVTSRYLAFTGDTAILDEQVHFLEGRPLIGEEDSYYDMPSRSDLSASLYEHCLLAIEKGSQFGVHGLPLMGSGDWNDGMDKVGEHGKGESVWLGFFLYDNLRKFSAICRNRKQGDRAEKLLAEAERLRNAVEKSAWDGSWYLRAWFDDGTPLGSAQNSECRIDSVTQSWSVLAEAGSKTRQELAMGSAFQHLVRKDHSLIQLLDPPFDRSDMNPGYIKGYVPGVRENGGQYTHAAIWFVMACAKMGGTEKAWELFNMINPVHHGDSEEAIAVYKVEPYVVAADVYSIAQHAGRGGWTWYTGSAGWMYRLIVESLLGLDREGEDLIWEPSIPATWNNFSIDYRHQDTLYHLTCERGVAEMLTMDGIQLLGRRIPLVNDKVEHRVVLTLT